MLTATDIHQLLEQGEHLTLECRRCENKLPNSLWELKPIFINGNPFTGSFRRKHEGDYRCTRHQVKAMARDSFEDGNDGFLLTQCDMDDILRIEKHEDKLVFRNPGLFRIPVEQVYEGGVSFTRNPKIQNLLRMVGYGENLGSGFPNDTGCMEAKRMGRTNVERKVRTG